MADKNLRMSIGAAVSAGLDDQTLDLIYDKLMDLDETGKIPVTAKIVFSVDAENLLWCDVLLSGNFPISRKTIRLKSDGKQLKLWDTPAGARAEAAEEKKTPVKVAVKKAAAKPAKKVAKKKAAAKPAKKETPTTARVAKRKIAASAVAGKPAAKQRRPVPKKVAGKPRALPTQTAEERTEDITRTNGRLYRDGVISREEAEDAGVDVDAMDGISGNTTSDETTIAASLGGVVGDLTPEELAGIDDLVEG